MAVELTPGGSRGTNMPRMPGPVLGVVTSLMVGAFRLLGDRWRMMGQPLLLLTTVGARSGKKRRTLLCRFPDGAGSWLVAASFSGSTRNPAWYLNLARYPDKVWVEIDGRTMPVQAESLRGQERAEAWAEIVARAPGYATYQEKTDREIPIVRLRAAA
jgi:deazaflavin-dependent oxidoreductase (nitroreductase family)